MTRVWLLPIEPLEERYSADWLRWWPRELEAAGHAVVVVEGSRLRSCIEQGQFLDAVDTNYYKATQLASFLRHVQSGDVRDGDVVLLLDGWSPSVSSLAYVRDTAGPKFKIAACLHAGTWDPHDYLSQCGLARWATFVELGWFYTYDYVFVATEFHKRMLMTAGCADELIRVTGFPLYPEFVTPARAAAKKERVVVFPHRLAPEKAPEVFGELQRLYEARYGADAEWVRTKDCCGTKAAYYDLLARAKVAVSAAKQETWGIAMIESALLGCYPVVPARLSYPETMPLGALYGNYGEAVEKIRIALEEPEPFRYDGARWERAIQNVAAVLP